MILILPPGIGAATRIAAAVSHGVAISIINVHLWARTSQMAMDEARAGRNRYGTIFGAVILTLHLATAISMAMLGPLIDQLDGGRHQTPIAALLMTAIGALTIGCSRSWQRSAAPHSWRLAFRMLWRKDRRRRHDMGPRQRAGSPVRSDPAFRRA
jgi:MFS family permease